MRHFEVYLGNRFETLRLASVDVRLFDRYITWRCAGNSGFDHRAPKDGGRPKAKTVTVASTPHHDMKYRCSHRVLPVRDWVLGELRWALEHCKGDDHEGNISINRKGCPWQENQRRPCIMDVIRNYLKRDTLKGSPCISWNVL